MVEKQQLPNLEFGARRTVSKVEKVVARAGVAVAMAEEAWAPNHPNHLECTAVFAEED